MSVHFEVETTGVTDRGAIVVSPPQRGRHGLAVGAPGLGCDHHLPAVRLRKYFSQKKIFHSDTNTHQLGSIDRGEAGGEERKHHVGVWLDVLVLWLWEGRGVE